MSLGCFHQNESKSYGRRVDCERLMCDKWGCQGAKMHRAVAQCRLSKGPTVRVSQGFLDSGFLMFKDVRYL